MALILLSAPASAQVNNDIQRLYALYGHAIVKVTRQPRGFGTGFFIQANPPVVATCFHVVAGQSQLKVETSAGPYAVTSVAALPDYDLAFLTIDLYGLPWMDKVVPWKPAPISKFDALIGFGYQMGLDVGDFEVTVETQRRALTDLGDANVPLSLRVPGMQIIHLKGDIREGDSGGPIFTMGGGLAGLAAGYVPHQNHSDPRFALPLDQTPTEFKPLPASGEDPYGSAGVGHAVYLLVNDPVEWSPMTLKSPQLLECRARLTAYVASFPGRRDELPATLPSRVTADGKAGADCQKAYVAVRPYFIEEDRQDARAAASATLATRASALEKRSDTFATAFTKAAAALDFRAVGSKDALCASAKTLERQTWGFNASMSCAYTANVAMVDFTGADNAHLVRKLAAKLASERFLIPDVWLGPQLGKPDAGHFENEAGDVLGATSASFQPVEATGDSAAARVHVQKAAELASAALGTKRGNEALFISIQALNGDASKDPSDLLMDASREREMAIQALVRARSRLFESFDNKVASSVECAAQCAARYTAQLPSCTGSCGEQCGYSSIAECRAGRCVAECLRRNATSPPGNAAIGDACSDSGAFRRWCEDIFCPAVPSCRRDWCSDNSALRRDCLGRAAHARNDCELACIREQ
jgi:hypothetical protein